MKMCTPMRDPSYQAGKRAADCPKDGDADLKKRKLSTQDALVSAVGGKKAENKEAAKKFVRNAKAGNKASDYDEAVGSAKTGKGREDKGSEPSRDGSQRLKRKKRVADGIPATAPADMARRVVHEERPPPANDADELPEDLFSGLDLPPVTGAAVRLQEPCSAVQAEISELSMHMQIGQANENDQADSFPGLSKTRKRLGGVSEKSREMSIGSDGVESDDGGSSDGDVLTGTSNRKGSTGGGRADKAAAFNEHLRNEGGRGESDLGGDVGGGQGGDQGGDEGWDEGRAEGVLTGAEDGAASSSKGKERSGARESGEESSGAGRRKGVSGGVTEEEELPVWMRAAHATIIGAATPRVAELRLDARLADALSRMGITRCFPVQATVIPLVLASAAAHCAGDVCVCAPTGSGKTLGYALPLLQSLLGRVVRRLRALVLLPTRGLAAQVFSVFESLCATLPLRVGIAVGGADVSWETERAALTGDDAHAHAHAHAHGDHSGSGHGRGGSSAVDILIATPGRLVEHLRAGGDFTLEHLRFLVIDEADRLLAHGYQEWLPQLLSATHRPRPTESTSAASALSLDACGCLSSRPLPNTAAAAARGSYPWGADATAAPPLCKMLFSATLSRSASKLAPLRLHRPRFFTVSGAKYATPPTLQEWMLYCSTEEKPLLLTLLLRWVGSAKGSAYWLSGTASHSKADQTERKTTHRDAGEDSISEDGGGDGPPAHKPNPKGTAGVNQDDEDESDHDDESEGFAPGDLAADGDKQTAFRARASQSPAPRSLEMPTTLIFTSSLEATHRLTRLLQIMQIPAIEYSSSLSSKQRAVVMKRLSSGEASVVVASDAMARGIDVDRIAIVINYDPPPSMKAYVHRVGRTARAGRKGTSYSLLRQPELRHFKHSMAKAGKSWRPLQLPRLHQALAEAQEEYDVALDALGAVMEKEKSGGLSLFAPLPSDLLDVSDAKESLSGAAAAPIAEPSIQQDRVVSAEEVEWRRVLRAQLHAKLLQRAASLR